MPKSQFVLKLKIEPELDTTEETGMTSWDGSLKYGKTKVGKWASAFLAVPIR